MYTRIANDIARMLEKKRQDYGDPDHTIGRFGLMGIAVRLMDKVERLVNLSQNGRIANFESIEDTLRDIAGYAILGLELLEKSEARETKRGELDE